MILAEAYCRGSRNTLMTDHTVHTLVTHTQYAKAHHKNHNQRKKWAWPWAREAPKYVGFPFYISATAALSS